jgi:hypothetical protein
LSVRLIREIHEQLMEGVRGGRLTPGELRRSQNWIGPGGAGLRDAVFVPPSVPQALSELENVPALAGRPAVAGEDRPGARAVRDHLSVPGRHQHAPLSQTGFAAANQLVARMAELGILREITRNARNRRFRYEPYVRLFTDDPAEGSTP